MATRSSLAPYAERNLRLAREKEAQVKAVRGHLVVGTAVFLGLGATSTVRPSELHAAAAKASPMVVTIRDIQ
jgi:hypothetical protein